MATIPRNHTRRIAEIKAKAVRCVVFSEANDFVARDCAPDIAWRELDTYDFARLVEHGTKWQVDVHSNLWYELREAEGT